MWGYDVCGDFVLPGGEFVGLGFGNGEAGVLRKNGSWVGFEGGVEVVAVAVDELAGDRLRMFVSDLSEMMRVGVLGRVARHLKLPMGH